MMKNRTFLFLFFIMLQSCSYLKEEKNENEVAARVYGKSLYREDLKALIPVGTSSEDSSMLAKNFIDNWIRQNIILHKAEMNLSDKQKDVEKQLQDYRNSLIIYMYEKELIREKLDTVVSDEEIEQYYKNNQSNFELKDNIIRVLYLRLSKNSPKIDKVRQWYKSNNPKDKKLLEEYCYQYALNYYLDDDTWLLFDDLLKEIPIKTYDKEQFLKNNRYIENEDSTSIYLVNIKGFKIKNSISPLSFEKENILNFILNQRKLILIEEMEKQSYLDALQKGDFEIY